MSIFFAGRTPIRRDYVVMGIAIILAAPLVYLAFPRPTDRRAARMGIKSCIAASDSTPGPEVLI